FGRGGPVATRVIPATGNPEGDPNLGRRASWRLQRDSLVTAGGPALSRAGFDDQDWVPATVPATVLTSYLNIGAIPDPGFGDTQVIISGSFFYADFGYRPEFAGPAAAAGKRVW